MPRKTKDQQSLEKEEPKKEIKNKKTSPSTKKVSTAKTKLADGKSIEEKVSSKKSSTKKPAKATTSKKVVADTKPASSLKTSSRKKTNTTLSVASTTSKNSKSTKSKTNPSSAKSKKTATRSTKKLSTSASKKKTTVTAMEYYDLPYRYNQTIVKILAQTPNVLFVYWDIADEDRKKYIEQYGEHFFEVTRPVLIVYNTTMNYSFEVEINDFANSWYIPIKDSKCDYHIDLGRRSNYFNTPNTKTISLPNNYLYITSSNKIETPNDRILFDKTGKNVFFRNIKTNVTTPKSITSISLINRMCKIYNIYDLYKEIYQEEDLEDFDTFLQNPSSGGNPSSTFK